MDTNLQLQEILMHYNLGELVSQQRDTRGTVNTSFTIETDLAGERRRYFLRRYKHGIKEEELQFEHALINHLVAKRYPPIARVHRTLDGATYLTEPGPIPGSEPIYYAIFDFLMGEDRYTWVDPRCTDVEVARSAQVLAQFHSALSDFSPQGKRKEPGILEFLPIISSTAANAPKLSKHTVFDQYLSSNLSMIIGEGVQTVARLSEPAAMNMPRVVVHSDFHPGNLKFEGEDVVGLFDFDWSKIDYRCFDLALGLFYFLVDWGDVTDGALRLDQFGIFLTAYQQECHRLHCLPTLTPDEKRYLPTMIQASNLYVMNWAIQDYYGKNVDPIEYQSYLKHNVKTILWFADPSNLQSVLRVISDT
jgi:homoserine kinase type II